MISVIVPGRSFKQDQELIKIYSRLINIPDLELVFVLNEIDCPKNVKAIECKTNSRSKKLNEGVKISNGELIILHHPRSILDKGAISLLLKSKDHLKWGGFTHKFDSNHWLLSFTSWYSNEVRAKLRGIIYLDHCIIVRRELYEFVGGIPEVDIFEDTLICEKLNQICSPQIIPCYSITSSIRFQKNGIIKQALLNQILKIGYYFGVSDFIMNKVYEKELNLNSKY